MMKSVDNRQEYDVREERRRELEFLEKVWLFVFPIFIYFQLIYVFGHHFKGFTFRVEILWISNLGMLLLLVSSLLHSLIRIQNNL